MFASKYIPYKQSLKKTGDAVHPVLSVLIVSCCRIITEAQISLNKGIIYGPRPLGMPRTPGLVTAR